MGSDSALNVFLTNWANLGKLLKIVQHSTGSPVVQSREVQCKSPQSIVMKLYKKELGRTGDAEPMAAGWSWQNGGSHRTQANRLQIAWNICPSPKRQAVWVVRFPRAQESLATNTQCAMRHRGEVTGSFPGPQERLIILQLQMSPNSSEN